MTTPPRTPRRVRDAVTMTAPLAVALSATYAIVGFWWTLGGSGYPFGVRNDPGASVNALGAVDQGLGGSLIAAGGLIGTIVGAYMVHGRGHGVLRSLVLAAGSLLTALLLLVVPDFRVLALVAYAPLYLAGAPFGWPPGSSFFDAITWPLLSQLAAMLGGVVWAAATVRYAILSKDRGVTRAGSPGPTPNAPDVLRRWGGVATVVAVAIPLVYATTRWAWALGIPLGISDELLQYGQVQGLWVAGAGLATVAVGGALLTAGLSLPFGETVPRWIPLIGGRRVPPLLAVVPALVVSALVTSAGLMFVRLALTGGLDEAFGFIGPPGESWAAFAPELLWPIWGVALAVAAVAYHERTRPDRYLPDNTRPARESRWPTTRSQGQGHSRS